MKKEESFLHSGMKLGEEGTVDVKTELITWKPIARILVTVTRKSLICRYFVWLWKVQFTSFFKPPPKKKNTVKSLKILVLTWINTYLIPTLTIEDTSKSLKFTTVKFKYSGRIRYLYTECSSVKYLVTLYRFLMANIFC